MVYIIKVRGLTSSPSVGMWNPQQRKSKPVPITDTGYAHPTAAKFPHFTGIGRGHVNHERYHMSRVQLQRYVFFQYIVFSAVVAVRVPTLKKRSPPECLAAFRTDFTRITGINAPTRRSGGYTSYRKDPPGTTRRCA